VAPAPATPARHGRYIQGIKERPEVVTGYTRQVRAPEGKVNITLNSDEDGVLEIFVNVGKAGSDIAALAEALGRLMSLHLRIDSPISQDERAQEIARQLRSIGGSSSIGFGIERVRSLPDAVARTIEGHFTERNATPAAAEGAAGGTNHPLNGNASHSGANPQNMRQLSVIGNLCPQCGNNTLYFEEGCKKCVSCGYSEC
jgi:ribonucleoside-diphosphate reductase alpha chain